VNERQSMADYPSNAAVRGVPATRCRLAIDLARADVALPAGVSVPSGPYSSLSQLPAEVWLDADGLAATRPQ
jgi:hypothetical protein